MNIRIKKNKTCYDINLKDRQLYYVDLQVVVRLTYVY